MDKWTDKWTHPQLGTFEFDGERWIAVVELPAFTSFSYGADWKNPPPFNGKQEMELAVDENEECPSAEVAAFAVKFVARQADLVRTITTALWDDINERGPDSGMWWRGDVRTLSQELEQTPSGPEDLLPLIRLQHLIIHKAIEGFRRPVAELAFSAAFDGEHGLGVLTDVDSILGFGGASAVTPW